ncbi:hypothetical protein BH23THE1_BH23THE1_10060 [soil metagenome]
MNTKPETSPNKFDKISGVVKWKIDTEYPPRVSPLVSNGVVYTG